jgi:hypothetical protein
MPHQLIPQWTVFETEFRSSSTYDNPFWDVSVSVQFDGPGGSQAVDAFWDGGDVWRLRFAPNVVGTWRWQTTCSDESNTGLHGQSGTLECVPYMGDNSLYQHGALTVSANRRYLQYTDGTPFFWLADTAWNGVLQAKPQDWEQYLATRRGQGFTAIQFVATQWRASTKGDSVGELAFDGTDRITLNPAFFQRADPKVAAINTHGLIASPVMLWTLTDIDPGQTLSEAACIQVARYEAARLGAYHVVWLVGGDGRYQQNNLVEKFRRIGQAVFADRHDRLATLHPSGVNWIGEDYRSEDWFDFIGYQSGHGDSERHILWLTQGPPAKQWNTEPVLPVINLEPNYEGHPAYESKSNFSAYHVRRASYWSLLVSPPAGVSYGNNEIWNWHEIAAPSENHNNIGMVQPWSQGLESLGLEGMTILSQLFAQLRWTELQPAQDLLLTQPGDANHNHFVAAAQTADGQQAIVYMPVGGPVELTRSFGSARWFDPRSGVWSAADAPYTAPDTQDWVLVLEA